VSSEQTQHILHAFSGLLQSIDPLLPVVGVISQSASLEELKATLEASTNLSDELRAHLYYALGARYMQLNAFELAAEMFHRCHMLGVGVTGTGKDVTYDLARINLAWCIREGAHRLSGPEGLSFEGKTEYEKAITFVSPISKQEYTTEDTEENYIILLAKNRHASILLSSDEQGASDTIKRLLSLDAELRRKTDSGSRHLAAWLLPVNSGNLGSAYMNVQEVDAEGEIVYLAVDEALEWHKKSEQDFIAAGLALHPEMAFAYRGQSEAYFVLGRNDEGIDCLRRAFEHRRDTGNSYTNNHLSELINFREALIERGNNSEAAADEILGLEGALCELMHSPRLEKGIHANVYEFHDAHCQNNK
jgi:tetratricopeptide (TPR) repeat protein